MGSSQEATFKQEVMVQMKFLHELHEPAGPRPLETFKSSQAFATIVQKSVTLDRIGRAPLFPVPCWLPVHCSFDHPLVAWLAAAGITLPRLHRINTLFRYAQPFCDGTSQAECVLSSCFLCRKQQGLVIGSGRKAILSLARAYYVL